MQNNRYTILQWVESGHIDRNDLNQAIKLTDAEPNATEWLDFLKAVFLWMGMISLCCGVIFYFAYNWQDMSRFTKFALIESVMLLSTFAYIRFAKTKLITSVTLMGMTLFTGALLALVGQTYQTGADPWQLFATWSLLVLPWAFVARATSLWIFWGMLINLSMGLFLQVSSEIFGFFVGEKLEVWTFSLLNLVLLCGFELAPFLPAKFFNKSDDRPSDDQSKQESFEDLSNRYVCQLAAFVFEMGITFLAIYYIFDYRDEYSGIIFYAIFISAIFYVYRYLIFDLFLLAAASASLIVVIVSVLIEFFGYTLVDGGFLVVGLVIIGLSTLAKIWLTSLSKKMTEQERLV